MQAKASEARPLALKIYSSKVLWRTLARSVTPALKTWAHVTQRGFVAGRVPGHGVIDVDTASRVVSVLHDLGVLSLYDFTSAFPSVSRSFILLVMQFSGFPAWSVSLTSASWTGAKIVDEQGQLLYWMSGGVGQGCPAAASAFVIGINPLLTALQNELLVTGGETLSAFADDIAVVLTCASRLHLLHGIFKEFELASALCLNFKKQSSYRLRRDALRQPRIHFERQWSAPV